MLLQSKLSVRALDLILGRALLNAENLVRVDVGRYLDLVFEILHFGRHRDGDVSGTCHLVRSRQSRERRKTCASRPALCVLLFTGIHLFGVL